MAVAAGQRSVAVLGPARRLPSQPPATMAAAQRVINQLPLSKAGAEERAAASRERKRGRQQELQAQQLLPLERLEYFFSKQEQQIQRRQLDASVRGKQQKQQPSWRTSHAGAAGSPLTRAAQGTAGTGRTASWQQQQQRKWQ